MAAFRLETHSCEKEFVVLSVVSSRTSIRGRSHSRKPISGCVRKLVVLFTRSFKTLVACPSVVARRKLWQ